MLALFWGSPRSEIDQSRAGGGGGAKAGAEGGGGGWRRGLQGFSFYFSLQIKNSIYLYIDVTLCEDLSRRGTVIHNFLTDGRLDIYKNAVPQEN